MFCKMNYVLITSARNEEKFIDGTIRSVVAQTQLPERWVIVDDGSMDRTAEIIEGYSTDHPWIELLRRPKRLDRNFAAKAHAVNAGLEKVRSLQFEVLGNLDADVSFEPDYMAFLMQKFSEDPTLGVAGTPFTEEGYDSMKDSFEGENYVAGPCQLFRYRCFEEIGGYVPNRGRRSRLDRSDDGANERVDSAILRRQALHHHRTMGTAEKGA